MSLGLLAHTFSCTWNRRVCVLVFTGVFVLLQRLYFLSQQLPVITSNTIVRCRSCRTYINPFVSFIDQRRWKCNLCYRVNDGECRCHCMTPFSVVCLHIAFRAAFTQAREPSVWSLERYLTMKREMEQSKTKWNEKSLSKATRVHMYQQLYVWFSEFRLTFIDTHRHMSSCPLYLVLRSAEAASQLCLSVFFLCHVM